MTDDPRVHAMKLVLAVNNATCRYVRGLIDDIVSDHEVGLNLNPHLLDVLRIDCSTQT